MPGDFEDEIPKSLFPPGDGAFLQSKNWIDGWLGNATEPLTVEEADLVYNGAASRLIREICPATNDITHFGACENDLLWAWDHGGFWALVDGYWSWGIPF